MKFTTKYQFVTIMRVNGIYIVTTFEQSFPANDLAVDESDTNAGMNDFDAEHNEGNRESNEINYNDPRDTMDISSEYDIEQLCSITDSLVKYYEGNCMRNTSQFVNEDDVNSAFGEMSFDNHPGENEVIENHDNVPVNTVDISTVIGNAPGFQLSDKYGDRRFKNRN
ncbi:unnamed protein product [Schistosoma haematobium]|nr:unnamed protein product [Schistosoma haematobium]